MSMGPMTNREIDAATDALIAWFKSQDISPHESLPVMAKAIVVACGSLAREADPKAEYLPALANEVKRASLLVTQTLVEILRRD